MKRLTFVLCVLALILTAYSQKQPQNGSTVKPAASKTDSSTASDNKASKETLTPRDQGSTAGATDSGNNQSGKKDQPSPNEDAITEATQAIAWLTGGLVFVGIITAVIAGLQWQALRQTKEAIHRTERAF